MKGTICQILLGTLAWCLLVDASKLVLHYKNGKEPITLTGNQCESGALFIEFYEFSCVCITGLWAFYTGNCERAYVLAAGSDGQCFSVDFEISKVNLLSPPQENMTTSSAAVFDESVRSLGGVITSGGNINEVAHFVPSGFPIVITTGNQSWRIPSQRLCMKPTKSESKQFCVFRHTVMEDYRMDENCMDDDEFIVPETCMDYMQDNNMDTKDPRSCNFAKTRTRRSNTGEDENEKNSAEDATQPAEPEDVKPASETENAPPAAEPEKEQPASTPENAQPPVESENPQPEPERLQSEPEKPQSEPEKPQPEPEKTQPEPEKTQPEPEKPQPEPEKPKTEPEKPKTEPEKPKTDPVKPLPNPEKVEPEKESSQRRTQSGRVFLDAVRTLPGNDTSFKVLGNVTVKNISSYDENHGINGTISNPILNSELWNYITLRAQIILDIRQPPKQSLDSPAFVFLDLAKQILKKACPDHYVSDSHFDICVGAFISIQKNRMKFMDQYVDLATTERIEDALTACLANMTDYPFPPSREAPTHPNCTDQSIPHGTMNVFNTSMELVLTEEASSRNSEPIVETVWKVFTHAHAACFPFFQNSINDHHRFTTIMLSLFTNGINDIWKSVNATTGGLKPDMYSGFLGNAVKLMDSVDYCSMFSRLESKYPWELPRPNKFNARRKREVVGIRNSYLCLHKLDSRNLCPSDGWGEFNENEDYDGLMAVI